jgi:hypothetical protein
MALLVTIIIPCAPYHAANVEQAIAAARSQSLPCDVVVIEDTDGRGAGWARNQAISVCNTPFILPLDADDTLRPDTVERMLSVYQRGKYVYADDWQGDSLHQTPDANVYIDGTWHTVSCLVPTVYAKQVGGFDETLPALEDLAFYLSLQAIGVCGVRCPHPLLNYSEHGRRSRDFKNHKSHDTIKRSIENRFREAARRMCNCGATVSGIIPDGKQPGDILVEALYTPMQMGGPVTGRLYARPRGAENYQLWVDPQDVDSAQGRTRWRVVMTADPNAAPAVEDVMALAAQAVAR